MQKGLTTRYAIYEILKTLKNHSISFEQAYSKKTKE